MSKTEQPTRKRTCPLCGDAGTVQLPEHPLPMQGDIRSEGIMIASADYTKPVKQSRRFRVQLEEWSESLPYNNGLLCVRYWEGVLAALQEWAAEGAGGRKCIRPGVEL